ncbi:beta strand repeat-containing protein [Nocardioides hwasunensis]|uniref:Tandem-95 repeat protein n=1 Tax=Nocardioides hwasunensis TaxID=397258 RepID=A0ABR8MHL9_9ACTN|nr:tandem-95 repeat protein [Nocardioides hwasunensis]MBD3915467.1 tandem-95 repeat protein [Nocardioides hwasunensis]
MGTALAFAASTVVATVVVDTTAAPLASANPAPTPGPIAVTAPGSFSGTVPLGSCFVDVRVTGGAGGHNMIGNQVSQPNANGAAARISARYAVVPGESFSGVVGGGGGQARTAGSNGGGNGGLLTGQNLHPGAGGGGWTSLQLDGTDVVVAGGGGGSGGGHSLTEGGGGDAGLPSGPGVTAGSTGVAGRDEPASNAVGGGGGGGTTASGAGGVNSGNAARNGAAGSGRTGGDAGEDATPDSGGGGGGGWFGAGGAASTVGNGGGGLTETGVTGAGGGGGSSYVAPTSPGQPGYAVSGVASTAVGKRAAAGAGANGDVLLTFVPCTYDLAVTKTVDDTSPDPGDTVTWTVTVANVGTVPMTRGDTVTLGDSLPGPGAKVVQSISRTGGSNDRGLARGPVTCGVSAGDPMPATLSCSRPYADGVASSADTGVRGLDPGEVLTVVYTQAIPSAASPATHTNTATVTDRVTTDSNDSATASITIVAGPPVATDDSANTPFNQAVTLPGAANDTPGDPGTPIQPGQTVFTSSAATNGGKTLTTAQGVWQVNPDGRVTFTPETGYSGTTPAVEYRITDSAGGTDVADLVVTVRPGPTASPDSGTTAQGVTVTLDPPVLGNDTPGLQANGAPGTFDVGSLVFVPGGTPGGTVSGDGKTLTIADQGVFTIGTAGAVSFAPAPSFTGVTTPAAYAVRDSLGNPTASTITITVDAISPTAEDDSASTPFGNPVEFSFVANDEPGAASAPIDIASGTFEASDNDAAWTISSDGKTITVPGEGAYVLGDDGRVTFTPQGGYVGTTTSVTYTVRDANGTPAKAGITVTVRPGPSAVDNEASTPQGVEVNVDVLVDDVPGVNADGTPGSWVTSSVRFVQADQPAGAVVSANGSTLTVQDEGVYTVQPNGTVTFDPDPGFRGVATPVVYTVTDTHGNDASADLTITVDPIDPVANDDAASTPLNTTVTLDGARDDAAGAPSAPLQLGLTVFPQAGQPAGAVVSANGKTLTMPDQGEYVIQADGSVEFTPVRGYTGTTTPVTYRIEDSNGTTDTAQLTVTVRRGPSASPDDARTPQNTDVVVPVLDNDSAGLAANGDQGAFVPASVVLPATGQPAGSTVAPDGKTLTVPGEGEYTVNADGTITFDPEPQFTGAASPITYSVTDEFGNDVSSTVVVTVTPIVPVATDDRAMTPYNTPVTLPGVTNDAAGATSAPLVPGRTDFPAAGQPQGSTVSADGRTVTVPGEGAWTLLADGTVLFTPADGFTGATTPVTYRIEDANGTTDTAQLTVTVRPAPKATNDAGTTPQNVDLTVAVLGNDVPGANADGTAGSWVATSVVFTSAGQPEGATVSADGKTLTVPGQGTYRVNPDGTITFDPVAAFTGTASPVTYAVIDSHGNPARATLAITVTPVVPTAADDRATTPHHTAVLIDVLGNDTAGSAAAPIDPATLRLVDPATGQPVTRVVVPGEGVWTVVDGQVRFEPEKGFSGTATPLGYVVSDANGTQVTATVTVVVGPAGSASPDKDATTPGNPVTVNVLGNDQAAPGEEMVPGSVCLLPETASGKTRSRGAQECVKSYTLDGVGTWVVNADGTITFTPVKGYTGTAEIGYTVTDTGDNVYESTISVTVKGDPDVGPSQGGNGGSPNDGGNGSFLPNTGGPQLALLVTALGLVLAGGALLLVRRRRYLA